MQDAEQVATPLPPLNEPDGIEMADQGARAAGELAVPATAGRAIRIAAVAFRQSSSSVSAASPLRPVRSTLVAPILPEPIVADVALAGQPRQQQPERDRPEQIAEQQAKSISGSSPRAGSKSERPRNNSALAAISRRATGLRWTREFPPVFFDSGVGGLSVLAPTRALIPNAPIVYVADSAGFPYGERARRSSRRASRRCSRALVERFQPRLIVIACNTASTIALDHARAALDLPVVGTVPAIKPASEMSKSRVIGVLGTQATVRRPYVDDLAARFAADCIVIRHGSPELVELAEAKLAGEPVSVEAVRAAAQPLFEAQGASHRHHRPRLHPLPAARRGASRCLPGRCTDRRRARHRPAHRYLTHGSRGRLNRRKDRFVHRRPAPRDHC